MLRYTALLRSLQSDKKNYLRLASGRTWAAAGAGGAGADGAGAGGVGAFLLLRREAVVAAAAGTRPAASSSCPRAGRAASGQGHRTEAG